MLLWIYTAQELLSCQPCSLHHTANVRLKNSTLILVPPGNHNTLMQCNSVVCVCGVPQLDRWVIIVTSENAMLALWRCLGNCICSASKSIRELWSSFLLLFFMVFIISVWRIVTHWMLELFYYRASYLQWSCLSSQNLGDWISSVADKRDEKSI